MKKVFLFTVLFCLVVLGHSEAQLISNLKSGEARDFVMLQDTTPTRIAETPLVVFEGQKKAIWEILGDKFIIQSNDKEFDFIPMIFANSSVNQKIGRDSNASVNEAKVTSTPGSQGRTVSYNPESQRGNQVCRVVDIVEDVNNSKHYLLTDNTRFYLGSVVDKNLLSQGVYQFVEGERKPINIISDLSVINGSPVKTIIPSRSEYLNAVVEFNRQGISGNPSTKVFYDYTEVLTNNQLDMTLDGHFNNLVHEVSGQFSIDWEQNKTRYLVNFDQVFYTLTTDDLTRNDFFEDKRAGVDDLYVSSISYGRKLLFLFESDELSRTVSAILKYSFDNLASKAEVNLSVEQKKIINQSHIKVYVQGGTGDASMHVITNGIEGIEEFLKEGAVFHPANNPGSPLFYRLRFCENGRTATAFTSTEYTKSECLPLDKKYKIELDYIHNRSRRDEVGQGRPRMEPYGKVRVNVVIYDKIGNRQYNWTRGIPNDSDVIYNKNRDQTISVELGEKEYIREAKKSFLFSNLDDIDLDQSYIIVKSEMKDWDNNTAWKGKDDDLFGETKVFLKDLFRSGNLSSNVHLGDEKMRLHFTISEQNVSSPFALK